ncbi:alpha/beta hydrolase family protein [Occultella glacieicola]|uniref:alpha/beta hydrolase family protein n=1 Tax=Occultella glacieicola TaxID=2518684 RepID=UPI001F1D53D2|nr:acyl-CoA thioester hydrolase/BAAT C-terminal domain-containing protein [Occultella glacieicola]
MIYRKLAAVLGLVLTFGVIGSLSGPGWNPEPLTEAVVPETADVAIGSDAVTDPVGTYETAQETIEVELDGARVLATVTYPVDAPDGRPGMLFMHGAGTATNLNFTDQAQALASAGVYAMVPEKRMDTYTTTERDYVQMARDYLVSWRILTEWPGVDPDMVGIYGESEGAWIAPVAAAEEPDVAFVVYVSAPVVPPREQFAFAADSYLRSVGVPAALLRAIPRGLGANMPGGGFEYADFDASPYQQRMQQPVLLIYGTGDSAMPTVQGPLQLIDDIAEAGNTQYTLRYFEGANHGIRIDGELAPGFNDALTRWVLGLPETATAEPRIAGDQPVQRFRAAPVSHPRWYADGDMLVASILGAFALLVIGPLAWVGSRLVRRPSKPLPPPLARYTAATALATVAVLVVFAAYIVQVANLALNYRTDDLAVHGGWVLLQAVGIFAVAVGVRSVAAGINARRTLGAAATGAVGRITWWGVHVGATVLLLIAAYWGVFPSVL